MKKRLKMDFFLLWLRDFEKIFGVYLSTVSHFSTQKLVLCHKAKIEILNIKPNLNERYVQQGQ